MGGGGFRSSEATQAPILLTMFHETPVKSAICRFTHFLGNHQKLFAKTIFASIHPGFQQSYPQISWISLERFEFRCDHNQLTQ
jgi:hypothetical protein